MARRSAGHSQHLVVGLAGFVLVAPVAFEGVTVPQVGRALVQQLGGSGEGVGAHALSSARVQTFTEAFSVPVISDSLSFTVSSMPLAMALFATDSACFMAVSML